MEAKTNNVNFHLEKQSSLIQKIEKDLTGNHEYDKNSIEAIRNRIFNATTNNVSREGDSDFEL
jgi:hypothetical protein